MAGDDDELLFDEDDEKAGSSASPAVVDYLDPWAVLVVDDDPQIHDMTRLLLKKFVFQGRGAELMSAYSAAEAKAILEKRSDIAVILLDVVMESEDAGLKLVRIIREDMGNKRSRIVLRTGQPGQAPEKDVILNYDINDYKSKTELTAQKLFTTMVASLRSYQDIVAIERNRVGLEKILNASSSLFDKRSMREFVEGAIIQLEALLRGKEGSILCCQVKNTQATREEIVILAGTRGFAPHVGHTLRSCLPDEICAEIEDAFHTQRNVFEKDRCILVFRTHDHGANVFFLRRPEPFTQDERTLLEVFCTKVAIGFDNVCLYEDLAALNNTLEQQVAQRTREAREKSRLLEATLSGMSDGLVAVDENGALVVSNPRAMELLGFEGRELSEIERRLARLTEANRLSTHGESEEIEFRDGRIVQLRRNDMDGGGYVYVCLDVTDERRQQRELIAARSQAEAANRAKSQFLATMSHEIRTPMTGVQGMLDLLLHTPLNDEQQELVGVVRESAASLLTIINDILDFSKIEAGKMALENAPLSVCHLVESTAEILAQSAFKKGVSLVTIVDPDLPSWLSGDPVRLRQILFNLLGNAVKFTERGHVLLRVEMIETGRAGTRILLSVQDTGIGISDDVRSKLFRPFSQADETTTRRFGGTGLGLSITRHLVELMGGNITLESSQGTGSTFSVELTLLPNSAPCAPEAPGMRLDGVSVAIELDDPFEREAAARYLTSAGAILAVDPQMAGLVILDGEKSRPRPDQPCVVVARRERNLDNASAPIIARPLRRGALLRGSLTALGHGHPSRTGQALESPAPAGHQNQPAILVAEDNPVNRMVIIRLLRLLGFEADVAVDGKQALEAWRQGRYDLLLTDCHMPEMDGFALSRQIRSEEAEGTHTPIVAFTAAATSDEVKECEDAGMDDFLPKPVDLERLKTALSRWLPVRAG